MKNSYKLLGEFWDKLEMPDTILFKNDSPYINNYYEEYNLFDLNGLRKISFSDILKIKDINELKIISNKIVQFKSLLIVVDYFPYNNKVIKSFYYKRLLQIYNYFKNLLQNNNVYLTSNCEQLLLNNKKTK